jgi:hypothetical protein
MAYSQQVNFTGEQCVMRVFTVLPLCVILSACGLPDLLDNDAGRFCTLDSRPSVVVTVVNPVGTIVDDARVTFSLNGGPEQLAECAAAPHPSGGCTKWMAERETPGAFTLRATSVNGEHTQQQISVSADECHVITEEVTLMLPSTP